jgi:hypothetical protein
VISDNKCKHYKQLSHPKKDSGGGQLSQIHGAGNSSSLQYPGDFFSLGFLFLILLINMSMDLDAPVYFTQQEKVAAT